MPDRIDLSQFRSPGEPLRIERLDPLVVQILRRMTPAERLERMLEMNRLIREGVTARLKDQHPDWSPERVHRELLRRLGYESG